MAARLLAAGAALAAVVAAGVLVLAWRGPENPEVSAEPSCDGPWSECAPNARWLRRVLARGGFGNVGPGTGSALLIPREGPSPLFLWAVPGAARPEPKAYSGYDRLPRIGGAVVQTDHNVRLRWSAQGRTVYLEPPPDPFLVRLLVVLTQVVPAP